jgi:hypothetical protein
LRERRRVGSLEALGRFAGVSAAVAGPGPGPAPAFPRRSPRWRRAPVAPVAPGPNTDDARRPTVGRDAAARESRERLRLFSAGLGLAWRDFAIMLMADSGEGEREERFFFGEGDRFFLEGEADRRFFEGEGERFFLGGEGERFLRAGDEERFLRAGDDDRRFAGDADRFRRSPMPRGRRREESGLREPLKIGVAGLRSWWIRGIW